MIPTLRVGRNSRGEKKLYLKLRDKLPDRFSVFHRMEYANITGGSGVAFGEIDFLIVEKELGLLAIEVKGGDRIEFHPGQGKWHSWDKGGKKHQIKDPFRQAKDGIYALIDKIQQARVFGRKGSRLPFSFGYSVSFPDAEVSCENFPPECPRGLVIDATDFPKLHGLVMSLYGHWTGSARRPGMDGKQYDGLINKVLMPEYRVARSVALQVQEEEEVISRLTDEQCDLLDFLGKHSRVLVEGYAGTGKTFLAFEKAKRLALDGKKVLLLCYNRPLADHLSRLVREEGAWSENVTVNNFHGFCIEAAEEAGLSFFIPENVDRKTANRFWREDVPLLLLEALENTDTRFDAVIIDEGQDFSGDWFEVITQVLKKPKKGCLYIFYDPMQDIYGKAPQFPVDGEPYVLIKNCRNTRSIASFVSRVGDIDYEFSDGSVKGKKVQTILCESNSEQLKKIDEIVKELTEGGMKPEQIVILSPRRKEKSCLAKRKTAGGVKLSSDVLGGKPGRIRFSTLHRFKGLEADAVIFCDVDGSHPVCDTYHQYVSMSRAKHLLYIIHTGSWTAPRRKGRRKK